MRSRLAARGSGHDVQFDRLRSRFRARDNLTQAATRRLLFAVPLGELARELIPKTGELLNPLIERREVRRERSNTWEQGVSPERLNSRISPISSSENPSACAFLMNRSSSMVVSV